MGINETLKRAEVFLGLEDEDLGKIAALPSCRQHRYEAEEVIFSTGDEAKYLYVLEEGQVDLVMDILPGPGQVAEKAVINTVRKGGFFGWSALVKPHSYVMAAVASRPTRVVVISGAELTDLFEKNHRIGYRVLLSLSHIIGARLRYLEQFLATGRRRPFLGRRNCA